jgi:hypothetical protein
MSRCCRRMRIWGRDQRGSFTLEAGLVFPWVLMIVFFLLFLLVWTADRVTVQYSVSSAGERAAFAWSHSSADLRTGAYAPGEDDGLYWRLRDDALLAGLFGWISGKEDYRVPIGDNAMQEGGLAIRKLQKTASSFPPGMKGFVSYRNRLGFREILTQASRGSAPGPLQFFGRPGAGNRAVYGSSPVTEPAEWIRTFDLVRYYTGKASRSGEGSPYLKRAGAALEKKS